MDFVSVLSQLFSQKLPGWDAHKHMCPPFRDEQLELFSLYQYEASVGIIFTARNNDLYVIFIKRINDGKAHSGEIAFPGGKIDDNDVSALDTAYREVYEEIGIDKQHLLFYSRNIKLIHTNKPVFSLSLCFFLPSIAQLACQSQRNTTCLHISGSSFL